MEGVALAISFHPPITKIPPLQPKATSFLIRFSGLYSSHTSKDDDDAVFFLFVYYIGSDLFFYLLYQNRVEGFPPFGGIFWCSALLYALLVTRAFHSLVFTPPVAVFSF